MKADIAEIPGTKVLSYFKLTDNVTKTMDSTHTIFKSDKNIDLDSTKLVYAENIPTKSMEILHSLSTNNPAVSPIIFNDRQDAIGVKNIINNMPITNTSISITQAGAGYNAANTSLVFVGPTGVGANGRVTTNVTTGAIESVIIDSEGFGYFDNVEVNIISASGSGAQINVNHELEEAGGNGLARYISKPVTLKDGLNGGDLRVRLTAVRPAESNVQVYYKVRNALDPNKIEDIRWKKMEQHTSPYFISTKGDPIEYEYRPSLTSNSISYVSSDTTYSTFNQFSIKVVLASSSTATNKMPKALDMIATALPADEF